MNKKLRANNKGINSPGDDKMGFTTYNSIAKPHVTIYRNGHSQIKKRGGQHKYGQGSYEHHETHGDAKAYAESTGLPIKNFHFCKPLGIKTRISIPKKSLQRMA